MLALIHLSPTTFEYPAALAALTRLARQHELVLICEQRAVAHGLIATLRRALPRYRLVAMMIDGDGQCQERELVEQLLEEGSIPLILTIADHSQPTSWQWLRADTTLVLPPEATAVA
jgi:hypothetical protein